MRSGLIVLGIAAAVAGGITLYLQNQQPAEPPPAAAPAMPAVTPPPAAQQPAPPPAPVAKAPAPASGPAMSRSAGPSPEEAAALEAAQDAQDLRDALDAIHSAEPDRRVEGADQLAAYPTPEAEVELVQAMTHDSDANVRESAAQSLSAFEAPSTETWNALLLALEDKSPDVQAAAEATLETVLLEYDENPAPVEWVRKAIKKTVKSKKLAADTRESLKNLIEQWEDSAQAP